MNMGLNNIVKSSEPLMNLANTLAGLFGKSLDGADDKALLGIFVIFYWTGAMIGRFIGSVLTRYLRPGLVLGVFGTCAILLLVVSGLSTGLTAMWSLLAVGLFNSIMFPTIFTMALDGLGDSKPLASGLLCTAIVGGAAIPPLYGVFADWIGFKWAFIILILGYGYIAWYAFSNRSHGKQAAVA